jgi:predicted N-acetyltransferase YhbS
VRRLDLRREEIEVEVMGRVWIERAKAEVLPHVRAWSLNAVATTVLQGALATGRLAADRNYAGLGVGTALAAHVLANRGGTQSAAEFGDTAVFVVRTALTCHEAMRAYDSIASVHT